MRKDHYLPPAKWTRQFRQALRLSDVHLKVYAYLESAPESHPTGIYFITLAAIAEMTGEERETVAGIVDDLERIGLVMWDAAASVVWVPCVCGEQYRWTNRPRRKTEEDYRLIEARKHLDDLPPSRLVNLFRQAWPIFGEAPTQAPPKPPAKGQILLLVLHPPPNPLNPPDRRRNSRRSTRPPGKQPTRPTPLRPRGAS